MKKIVSLVLAMSMVLSMFVSAFAATKTLSDIADTKYASSVESLVELKVIDGLPDGTYGPEKEVTRAQLAKMLVICLGLGDSVEALEGKTMFTDVADSHWATGYINAAAQSKVIAGYPDGTFKPEKNVSYAEAVTMVIRALGYGNVVDTEGTWPTAYMLKAVELELLDDMDSPKSGEAALRGNVAILLWNMLRTPMWKITSESQGMGMTSQADALMLNVKFPAYRYVEDLYLTGVTVIDGEVTATVNNGLADTANGYYAQTAKIVDADLPRLIEGMRVSALIKDYKEEDATFLTLTPTYSIVEGVVTKAPTASKIEIDEVEYTLKNANEASTYATQKAPDVGNYVVMEVDGKKVVTVNGEARVKVLPTNGTEVERITAMEKEIKEDDLVIIDGVWSTREDVEIGDVYTRLPAANNTYYFAASSERVNGTFEALKFVDDGTEASYVEVDGEEYRIFVEDQDSVIAYEEEDNEKEVKVSQLLAKASDNKYLDKEVELVLNYLGQIFEMNFGEVEDLAKEGNFYAVKSNGAWPVSSREGKVYSIELVGLDGEVDTYTIAANVDLSDVEEDRLYGLPADPVFVFVRFNDKDEIKEITRVSAGEIENSDYTVVAITEEMELYKGKMGDYRINDSTVVLTSTPIIEDEGEANERIVDFEVESSEGEEALKGVTKGFIVYETESITNRAKFVLVPEEAKSQDLNFGTLTQVLRTTDKSAVVVTIEGKEYNADLDDYNDNADNAYSSLRAMRDTVVSFTENDGVVSIKGSYVVADVADAPYVEKTEDDSVQFSDVVEGLDPQIFNDEKVVELTDEDTVDEFADFTFVQLVIEDDEELGLVLEFVKVMDAPAFNEGDRVLVDGEVVFVVDGLKANEVIADGEIVKRPEEPETYKFALNVVFDELTEIEIEEAKADLTLPEATSGDYASGDEISIPVAASGAAYKYVVTVEGAEADATEMPANDVTVTVTVSKIPAPTTYAFTVVVDFGELTEAEITDAETDLPSLPTDSSDDLAAGAAITIPQGNSGEDYEYVVTVEGAETDATVMPANDVTVTVTVSKKA